MLYSLVKSRYNLNIDPFSLQKTIIIILITFCTDLQSIQSYFDYSHEKQLHNDYDCLISYVSNDIVEYVLPYILRHQIIEYCVRPDSTNYEINDDLKTDIISNNKETRQTTYLSSFPSCYKHLDCGDVCLDWRQICDGIIDCINSGQDEENCSQLEMNECHITNEYRCHNGIHCIPIDFLHDDALNPDCIDRSDEAHLYSDYPDNCTLDMTFRCDEHRCRPSESENIPCGDGQCTKSPFDRFCKNKREVLLEESLIKQLMMSKINESCLRAMICMIDKTLDECQRTCLKVSSCNHTIQRYCPLIPFAFPSSAILFDHIYFVYDSKSMNFISTSLVLPSYICFNQYLCNHLIRVRPVINISAEIVCQDFIKDLKWPSFFSDWFELISYVKTKFQICSTIYVDPLHCQINSTFFYHCKNSTKCISKHRLMDDIQDCVLNDDEKIRNSCKLDDQHLRFQCSNHIGKVSKCLALITVQNQINDCDDGRDEIDYLDRINQQNIPFATVCDGFIDLIDPDNTETDETYCDWWQCNNIYTQCDGVWNCRNGADELNCSYLPVLCSSMHHLCVSPYTFKAICLPLDMAGNGHTDCVGGTDERHLCRFNGRLFTPFRCRNDTNCLELYEVCNGEENCNYNDDETFCSKNSFWESEDICMPSKNYQRTLEEKIICLLNLEQYRRQDIFFALEPRIVLNRPIKKSIIEKQEQTTVSSNRYFTPLSRQKINMTKNLFRCNRGKVVRDGNGQLKCLCSPAYYGSDCQYQNQRVSLTLQIRAELDWHTVFLLAIFLVDDNQQIESYDYIEYLSVRDCLTKFDIYLLYSSRPKDSSKNYSVRIDVYDKILLTYRTSWLFPLKFSFLPVHRLAIQLIIPLNPSRAKLCSQKCEHGQCILFENYHSSHIDDFCLCDRGWSGRYCTTKHDRCQCSSNSVCIGDGSFCLCPLNKYGIDCLHNHSSCQQNTCQHNGKCIGTDIRMLSNKNSKIEKYKCLCSEGYSEKTCKYTDSKIYTTFHSDISIPPYIFAHFITILSDSIPDRITMFKKIPFDRDEVILYMPQKFHLVFIEFSKKYYLTIIQKEFKPFTNLSTQIISSHRCRNISELFNSSILQLDLLLRVKLYHLPCQEDFKLLCFYDHNYMCLCDSERRQANCFEFDHNIIYNCRSSKICQNNAQCFQDDSSCPKTYICACAECYYGTRCQLSTKGFELSVDAILGYQIRPNLSLWQQPFVFKFSIIIVTIMLTLSFISNSLSLLTFRVKETREVGCGLYLLVNSITSLLTMIVFTIKFVILLLTHMSVINNRILLRYSCISINLMLSNLLNSTGWLSTCVAVERFIIVVKGINFHRNASKKMAKLMILIVILFCNLTVMHDPLHRHLFDDLDENRIWCVVSYPSSLNIYNSFINTFHFLGPFTINFLSTIMIVIIITYRKRYVDRNPLSYKQYFWKQFRRYQHIFLSQCFLVLLVLPRLIVIFISGCMKSARDPWLFLAGSKLIVQIHYKK
ncbi:hypothetical protein I4U23_004589 [Adineta vaga]|nr:hypothetical protein I4U23_004589 [Adineta vaga]